MAIEIGFGEAPARRWEPEDGLLVRHVEYGTLGILVELHGLDRDYEWLVTPLTPKIVNSTMFTDDDLAVKAVTTTWEPLPAGTRVTLEQAKEKG